MMKLQKMVTAIVQFFKHEIVLCAAVVLSVVSVCIVKPSFFAMYEAIDWRVLCLLFCLMLIIQAFRSLYVLDAAANFLLNRCTSVRSVYVVFVVLVFVSSMVVTNDVALLTFVPISLLVCRRAHINPIILIILETLAANLGSCVTPMGNPQNLFLYSFYNMESLEFFKTTLLIALPSAFLLYIAILQATRSQGSIRSLDQITASGQSSSDFRNKPDVSWRLVVYMVALIVILLSVFRMIDYKICILVTGIAVIVCNFRLFARVDYSLLLTFVAFFLFTKNILLLPEISNILKSILNTPFAVYAGGIGASQIISNVPAALLLSEFSDYGRELLLGVNVGGLGTLIASLASVISYKLYTAEVAETQRNGLNTDPCLHENGVCISSSGSYLFRFTVYNLVFLAVLVPLVYALFLWIS